jgi:thiosulfate/3-mercaptopyruvate sulfurtransferase
MTELTETLPGVWFWEETHPDWEPGDSYEPTVRCWVIATGGELVLVDPLVREDTGPDTAWSGIDALVAEHGRVHAVIRTLHSHHRSCAQASARYDVPIYARPLPHDNLPVHPFDIPTRDRGTILGDLVAHHIQREDELVLWIPSARALLFSDVGQRREGRFELCPEWWMNPPDSWGELRRQMRELAALEPEHLLVSHGPHQLADGDQLTAATQRSAARRLPPFISLDELAQRRETWTLVDARLYLDGRSERDGYVAGHLPGARFLDFDATLTAPQDPEATTGRHPLPTPERFAAGLAAAGISAGDTVVAYDDGGGVLAARLVWMLRSLGEDAALLSPVPGRWESGPVPQTPPGHFPPQPWPADRFATIEEVAARDMDTVLLDARDPGRYAGDEPDPVDPRAGHIPGAANVSCRANVDAEGRLAGAETLEQRFSAAGVGPTTAVISACGSGVTACHNLLALESINYAPGRLYVGSFSEWSRDPTRPVETGA